MRTTIKAVALSVIAMVITMTGGNAFALHRQTPFLEPIPFPAINGVQSFRPFCQGDAARWQTFDSTSDLMHNGSSGDEIFLWDNDPAGPRHLVQVTNCAVGDSRNPAADANGKIVVFESTSNLAAPPATRCTQLLPTHRIFRAQQVKGAFAYDELTAGLNPAADCSNAVIDEKGFRVAFQCTGDLRGNGSTGTNVYLWRNDQTCDFQATPPCSDVQQISLAQGDWVSENPAFNTHTDLLAGGGDLVFNSNAPIDGNSNGFQQIWLYSITGNPPIGCPSEPGTSPGCPKPIRLTNGAGDSTHPSISQDARFVVFQSTADLLGTGSTGSQIFLLDRTTGILQQLTQAAGDSTLPSISGNGRYIIFLSTGDFGFGGGGPHVLLFDQTLSVLYQVTSGPGSAGNPIATADTIFFFDSDEDPTKTGITGRQIYALNVFLQVPKPAMGPATFKLMPGNVDSHGVASGGSSVRLITESTFGANPETSYIIAPIGNASTGAGSLNLASLGINPVDQEGAVTVPKMTIPPIPVRASAPSAFNRRAPAGGRSTATATPARRSPTCSTTARSRTTSRTTRTRTASSGARRGRAVPVRSRRRPRRTVPAASASRACAPTARLWVRRASSTPSAQGRSRRATPSRGKSSARPRIAARATPRCPRSTSGNSPIPARAAERARGRGRGVTAPATARATVRLSRRVTTGRPTRTRPARSTATASRTDSAPARCSTSARGLRC